MTKPLASLSIDLDNRWSYLKTHGDAGWQSLPSYLDTLVPRVLELLARHRLAITWFVVGQDAALPRNAEALGAIAPAGHEIGNHSFHHEPWLHLYTPAQIAAEIARAEDAIAEATGAVPRGFRGPGFSLSLAVLETLADRSYAYDCSTFPTFIGPVARAYYFFTAKLSPEERAKRRLLFGGMREGLRPLTPYRWQLAGGRSLLEIPVTTMPGTRAPFHLSYVLYLATFSEALARRYWQAGLRACRLAGVEPSILLHPLDFLGAEDATGLDFFPAMRLPAADKLALVDDCLGDLTRAFRVLPVGAHAEAIAARGTVPARRPRFAPAEQATPAFVPPAAAT